MMWLVVPCRRIPAANFVRFRPASSCASGSWYISQQDQLLHSRARGCWYVCQRIGVIHWHAQMYSSAKAFLGLLHLSHAKVAVGICCHDNGELLAHSRRDAAEVFGCSISFACKLSGS